MKTAFRLLLLLIGFGCVQPALGQNKLAKRFNVWYFGNKGGIDFNGSPRPLTNSRINYNAKQEPSAMWCDENGALAFYTDGMNVWNRNHFTMPGSGPPASGALGGNPSSTQGALIVPHPGDPNRFYVFSTAKEGLGGLQVAEVNMAQNNGLGAVTSKNQVLLPKVTEKLQAVQHCNGSDYWVIAHEADSDRFATFLVSSIGLQPAPTFQKIGAVHAVGSGATQGFDCTGQLKASPSGNRLAAAILGQDAVELFEFDNTTGTLRNLVRLTGSFAKYAYGVEFSPNGKWLYVSGSKGERNLYQLDLSQTTSAALQASAIRVGQTPAETLGALQLGPDAKIYVANFVDNANTNLQGYPRLGVINRPDERGAACQYAPEGFDLGGGKSGFGLPNLIAGFSRKTPEVVCQQVIGGACGGGLLRALVINADTVTYEWFRNGLKINGETKSTFKPNVAGKFKVKIKEALTPCPLEAESAEVEVSLLNTTTDLKPQILPQFCGTFVLKINVSTDFDVLWTGPGLSGSTARLDTVRVSGQTGEVTYRVSATSRLDPTCKADTSLKVNFTQPPPYRLGNPALNGACGQSLALNAPAAPGWTELRWQLPDGQIVTQNPYVTRVGGTYTVLARNASGCESRDQVTVTFQGGSAPPQLSAPVTACSGQPAPALTATGQNITWFADSTLTTRLGTGNSFVPTLGSRRGAVYFFATQTSSEGCASRAARTSVVVAEGPRLALASRSVVTCFDDNQPLLLDAGTEPGVSYVWSRAGASVGASGPTLGVRAPGLYRVRATSAGGCASTDSVEVVEQCKPFVYLPDVFTPNGDGVNDEFAPKGQAIDEFELVVYNRWGEAIHRTQGSDFAAAAGQFWNGTLRGQAAPTGVYAWRIRVRSAQWPEPFVKAGQVLLQR
jgi:gliding motility-associated-like protein